jgi:hypothetical protein
MLLRIKRHARLALGSFVALIVALVVLCGPVAYASGPGTTVISNFGISYANDGSFGTFHGQATTAGWTKQTINLYWRYWEPNGTLYFTGALTCAGSTSCGPKNLSLQIPNYCAYIGTWSLRAWAIGSSSGESDTAVATTYVNFVNQYGTHVCSLVSKS